MNKKITTAATFGAGLAAMGIATELQADVITLDFSPGSFAFQGSTSVSTAVALIGAGAGFNQWNDAIGKTLFSFTGDSMAIVQASQSLNAGSSFGGGGTVGFTASASGTQYIGFNVGGNVGWFSLNLGGVGGAITYLDGAFGNAGETVHVGTVPAPGGLAVLALGALGVRRKKRAA